MGETANEIEARIERTRDDLVSNIRELEQKVEELKDWKHYFRNSPAAMLGAAFGGGIVLARMMGGKNRLRSFSSETGQNSYTPNVRSDRRKYKTSETWDTFKGALIGIAPLVLGISSEKWSRASPRNPVDYR